MIPPKWFIKVKIVVSPDYHFTIIAMIDSGADMNCIQEGLIPSKYFEKYTERLVSANGSQMKIKYELNNAYVCHDNVCFKIPYVLVKNMIDKVNRLMRGNGVGISKRETSEREREKVNRRGRLPQNRFY